MKRVRDFTIETAHALFQLRIFAAEDGKNYVGQYTGSTPKLMQLVRPKAPKEMATDFGGGKQTDQSLDRLIATCRTEIEKIDGRILDTTERTPQPS
jgi:hypothetical protein